MLALLLAFCAAETPFRFEFSGKPHEPNLVHVVGTQDAPAADDLLLIGRNFRLPLGAERVQKFHGDQDTLEQFDDKGTPFPVAVKVTASYVDPWPPFKRLATPRLSNPLAKLTPAQRRRLRCVVFEAWTDEVAAQVADLDPSRVCLVFGDVEGQTKLPMLPAGLRHLAIDEGCVPDALSDYSALAGLQALRSFSLKSRAERLDIAALGQCRELRWLEFQPETPPRGLAELRGLRELRTLDCSWARGVRNVDFAGELPKLERVILRMTAVRSVAALGSCPALKSLDAQCSAVRDVPNGPAPALRELLLVGARTPLAEAERFAKERPQCRVARRWNALLADHPQGIDALRVRSGFNWAPNPEDAKLTLALERDPGKIAEFLAKVRVEEQWNGEYWMCEDAPTIELRRGGKVVQAVAVLDGRSLRAFGGWPGDIALTPDGAAYLQRWLAERVPAIKAEQDRAAAEVRQQQERLAAWTNSFPPAARDIWRNWRERRGRAGEDELAAQLLKSVGDGPALGLSVCRALDAFGGEGMLWNSTGGFEPVAFKALDLAGPQAWSQALATAEGDPAALRGAARAFLVYDKDQLTPVAERAAWRVKLARVALATTHDEIKHRVLEALGKADDAASLALLREALAGTFGEPVVPNPYCHEKLDLPAMAAVALAWRNDAGAKPEIVRLLAAAPKPADRLAFKAALALLGDPAQLDAEQFRLESEVVGMAAIRAIERFRGAHGLDLLIGNGLHHPWAAVNGEAALAAQRIIGKEYPIEERDGELKKWLATQGVAFIAKRRAEAASK